MHRVANKGDFPSDNHLDKAARVRPSMETSTDEKVTPMAQENLGLQLTNFLEQEQM